MDIGTFIESERQRPFTWGETDCATTADRWFKIVRGFSPMARYGRLVMNEVLGRAWLSQPGGILRAVRDVARCAEVTRIHGNPFAGDIGVIIVDNRACVAIYDGTLWCSRDEDGFIVADDMHRYVAWEVALCRKL